MNPTDGEILDFILMRSGSIMPTYFIKNMLRTRFPRVKTPWVLRRLKVMEKAGKVRRVPSNYATMICWDVATQAAAQQKGDGNE